MSHFNVFIVCSYWGGKPLAEKLGAGFSHVLMGAKLIPIDHLKSLGTIFIHL